MKIYGEKRKGYLIGKLTYKCATYEITQDTCFYLYKVESSRMETPFGGLYCETRELIGSYEDLKDATKQLSEII